MLQRKNFHLPIDSDGDKSPYEAKTVYVRAEPERWEGSIAGLVLYLLLSRQNLLFVLVY